MAQPFLFYFFSFSRNPNSIWTLNVQASMFGLIEHLDETPMASGGAFAIDRCFFDEHEQKCPDNQ